jgi:hypothetical protein
MAKQPPPLGEPFGVETWDSGGSAEDFAETKRLLATIPGGPELISWFGGTASFHDAEVVRLHLDREGASRLELSVGWPSDARVTFILTDWIDANISGFSHQNVIGELLIREPTDREAAIWERGVGMLAGDHEIVLAPIFRANGTIRATISKIELTELGEPN